MRKTLLSVVLVLGLSPLQADEYEYLWLHSPVSSGTRSYSLGDLHKITFGEEAMSVYLDSQSQPVTWSYANLWKMTFEANPATAVESLPQESGLVIRHLLNEVRVESPSPLKSVVIYSLQGVRFATFGRGETAASYPLSALPTGVYIVRAEESEYVKTLKFVKH